MQLINDTAHDIRSPLAGVRESIRLVEDGQLGALNHQQRDFLRGAIDNCDAIEQLVGHLVQLDVNHDCAVSKARRWMTIDQLMQTMGRTIDSWATAHGVAIQIDPMVSASTQVFVDPHGLTRLVSNLVQNASRASRKGQNVLIRYTGGPPGDAVTWSVIDRGSGMSAADLKAASKRGVSLSGGTGLGLSICQDLAAVHHSTLKIRSRVGSGTTVQFQTAAGGPAAVAAAYARWRLAIRGSKTKPRRRELSPAAETTSLRSSHATESVRLDRPQSHSAELESFVELKSDQRRPMVSDRVMIGTVQLGAMVPSEIASQVVEVLPRAIGHYDFVEAIDERNFIYAIDETRQRFADRTDQIDAKILRRLPQARLQWLEPQEASIDDHRWVTRFADLATHRILATQRREHSIAIIDEARLGTDVVTPSAIASVRLEEEMRRLGSRMKSQNQSIRNQAQRLRSRD